MKLETYKAKFVEFTEQAIKLSSNYKSKVDLQKKITSLSNEAVQFYQTNSDYKKSDYQLRIEIFLNFDNILKSVKKDFFSQSPDRKRKSFFTNQKQIKYSNSCDTAPLLDNSVTP